MREYYFWDIDECDCQVEAGFVGTITQAKRHAVKLAKKYNTTICVYDAKTHEDVAVIDATGEQIYI